MEVFILHLIVINIMTFYMFGKDKRNAKRKGRRIPEKVLMGVALLGGSVGALLGMWRFRHKIRKVKFFVGVPLIFLLQCAAIICLKFLM